MNEYLKAHSMPLDPSDIPHALASLKPHELRQPHSDLLKGIAHAQSPELIRALVTVHGMDIDAATIESDSGRGYTLLWFGCHFGYPKIISACLDLGADPMWRLAGGSPVWWECYFGRHCGSADIIDAMMLHPRSVDSIDTHERHKGQMLHAIRSNHRPQ